MKLQTLSISVLAAIVVHSGQACGPSASNTAQPTNNTTSSSAVTVQRKMSPGRESASRKRIIVLKQQMREYEKAQKVADKLDLMLGHSPYSMSSPSREEQRRYLMSRFEYLALKAERGRATSKDIAEMRQLQHELLGR